MSSFPIMIDFFFSRDWNIRLLELRAFTLYFIKCSNPLAKLCAKFYSFKRVVDIFNNIRILTIRWNLFHPRFAEVNMAFILFRLYWHKLKTLNYITKLIMFSHDCVVTRNYITAKNNIMLTGFKDTRDAFTDARHSELLLCNQLREPQVARSKKVARLRTTSWTPKTLCNRLLQIVHAAFFNNEGWAISIYKYFAHLEALSQLITCRPPSPPPLQRAVFIF